MSIKRVDLDHQGWTYSLYVPTIKLQIEAIAYKQPGSGQ